MTSFTILHNPRCSKSRAALALLEHSGYPVEVVAYLNTPPSAEELQTICANSGLSPAQLLRDGEAEYHEAGLHRDCTDAEIIAAMVRFPKLINRPIVIRQPDGATVLGRPTSTVAELIESAH
ncbi:arsenate reductase (glutaredoxin) [Corynebacterium aquilae]|uniref:Arsenate reductase n=1 Tax=Corynebacterium aquilae DSM 44791 TaxID=1431546 RepID=A0A1L7CF53_9CORY|nr:arsenate reductase (glutaredoxin) [Corynebacterium aquilae]APT84466.1 hypothetical protein CAQU_04655 [Corynebacterium aquilae DSM 44791]